MLLFGILLGFLSRKADPKRFKEARLIAVSVWHARLPRTLSFLVLTNLP